MPDYFTLAEFRLLPDMDDTTAYPDARVEAAAEHFTSIVEREVGVPFVPRTVTETLDGSGGLALVLSSSHVRSVTTVTVDGTAVDVSGLSGQYGLLRYSDGSSLWTVGIGNVEVTYEAGEYATCPADIKEPVMWAVRDRLLEQSSNAGIDARKTSATNEFGGTINYVLPGEKRPTGYPELDAAIAGRMRSDHVGGFA